MYTPVWPKASCGQGCIKACSHAVLYKLYKYSGPKSAALLLLRARQQNSVMITLSKCISLKTGTGQGSCYWMSQPWKSRCWFMSNEAKICMFICSKKSLTVNRLMWFYGAPGAVSQDLLVYFNCVVLNFCIWLDVLEQKSLVI